MEQQLSLDLKDEYQYCREVAKGLLEKNKYSSNTSVRIFRFTSDLTEDEYVLGTRTHLYETNYEYTFSVSEKVAVRLLDEFPEIIDHLGWMSSVILPKLVDKYFRIVNNPIYVDKITGKSHDLRQEAYKAALMYYISGVYDED